MPVQLNYFECSLCGQVFKERGHAVTCERLHIQYKDLNIYRLVEMKNGRLYAETSRLPAMLELSALYENVRGIYTLRGIPNDELPKGTDKVV